MNFLKCTLICLPVAFCGLFACNAETPLPKNAAIDSIVVVKHKRQLMVYGNTLLLKIYIVALGEQPAGPKHFEGDMRTPEGMYRIYDKNPNSKYHKNLGISYPNARDREYANRFGRKTGGDVKIHGLPPSQGYLGALHRQRDWTHGCIAVTNEEIDELFVHVKTGSPINILP